MTRIDVGAGISIYVHLPFCLKKCNYCGFYSESTLGGSLKSDAGAEPDNQEKDDLLIDEYIDALLQEAGSCSPLTRGRKLISLYLGGGTPTVLSERQLSKLTAGLTAHFNLLEDKTECAIEANPESITRSKAQLLKKLGYNRISLGAQSFNDKTLKLLGRVHTAQRTIEAFRDCRSAGFSNISLDLMFGYSGQTQDDLMADLKQMIDLDPEHISLYALSVDNDALWAKDKKRNCPDEPEQDLDPLLLDPDSTADLYEIARKFLKSHGFIQYEISNFAKKGFRSKHNEGYWTRREYLGLGASAASLYHDKRKANVSDIREYIQVNKSALETASVVDRLSGPNAQSLSPSEILEEVMFLGLRRRSGISKSTAKRFAVREHFSNEIEDLRSLGMIVGKDDIRLSAKALFISNEVLCRFLH